MMDSLFKDIVAYIWLYLPLIIVIFLLKASDWFFFVKTRSIAPKKKCLGIVVELMCIVLVFLLYALLLSLNIFQNQIFYYCSPILVSCFLFLLFCFFELHLFVDLSKRSVVIGLMATNIILGFVPIVELNYWMKHFSISHDGIRNYYMPFAMAVACFTIKLIGCIVFVIVKKTNN